MIRLRFVQGHGWASRLIAWFSADHLSHVDAIMPDGTLLGARSDDIGGVPPWRGVRRRHYVPEPYEPVRLFKIYQIPSTNRQEAAFYGFLASQEGRPYDKLAILAFFIDRNWRDEDAWYCSELQAAALIEAGLLAHGYLSANKITPVMLAELVSLIPGAVQVPGR